VDVNGIKNRSLQTDLMRNTAETLRVIACMDDRALKEISDIVYQIDQLANDMEGRISDEADTSARRMPPNLTPNLTIV